MTGGCDEVLPAAALRTPTTSDSALPRLRGSWSKPWSAITAGSVI